MNAKTPTLTGTVTKLSSAETIKVAVKYTKVHPLYRKRYTISKQYLVHNPVKELAVGDTVTIASCRPISKLKRWVVA